MKHIKHIEHNLNSNLNYTAKLQQKNFLKPSVI